jgi:hypothetical protein
LAIGKAQRALGPRSADMRLRPGEPVAGGAGFRRRQTDGTGLNQSFIVFFNVWATNPA